MKITILTPLFHGDSSGASVYYKSLTHYLLKNKYNVSVISDNESGEYSGQYYPVFPKRCGQNKRGVRDIFSYAKQNILYWRVVSILRHENTDILIVHSSFYYNPGIFMFLIRYIKHIFPNIRMILDVRDAMFPVTRGGEADYYNGIIACSRNVKNDLVSKGIEESRITHIPVIQAISQSSQDEVDGYLEDLEITRPYLLYAGLIKESKSVDVLLEAFTEYIRVEEPRLTLVLTGLMKTSNNETKSLLHREGVKYIGNRTRGDVLKLMQGADCCINISRSEGMPRSSLEALALNIPTALPPNVPEFLDCCSSNVIENRNTKEIAQKILGIYRGKKVPMYPIEEHYPGSVFPKYIELISSIQ